MKTKFKGFIFDMDGTIVDSKIDFKALYQHFNLPAGHGILEHISNLTDEEQINKAHEVLHHYEMQGALLSEPIHHAFEFLSYLNDCKNNYCKQTDYKISIMGIGISLPL